MFETAEKFILDYPGSPLRQIRFTNFDNLTVNIFMDEFENRYGI